MGDGLLAVDLDDEATNTHLSSPPPTYYRQYGCHQPDGKFFQSVSIRVQTNGSRHVRYAIPPTLAGPYIRSVFCTTAIDNATIRSVFCTTAIDNATINLMQICVIGQPIMATARAASVTRFSPIGSAPTLS